MTNQLRYLGRLFLYLLPFLFMMWRNRKCSMKADKRSRQFLLPILALLYCILVIRMVEPINEIVNWIFNVLPRLIQRIGQWIYQATNNSGVYSVFTNLATLVRNFLNSLDPRLRLFAGFNALVVWIFMMLKRILLMPILKKTFRDGNELYEKVAGVFYEKDKETGKRTLKSSWFQAEKLVRTMFYGAIVIAVAASMGFLHFFKEGQLTELFEPVYPLLILAEIYHYLNGPHKKETPKAGEQPGAAADFFIVNLRPVLRKLFGKKLLADETTSNPKGKEDNLAEMLEELENSSLTMEQVYGKFLQKKIDQGLDADKSYVKSGVELLHGRSILFNNPFYYDLLPYLFFPVNRMLLQHQKVLVVAGRHGVEEDLVKWCKEGLHNVTNVPTLWNVGVLSPEEKDWDVGILTRSDVHDLHVHESNREFFEQVGFVILMEPSKLLATAQVGLRSIVQHCHLGDKVITYCSIDKNCDGLVDALSHVLMTNITEVSASNHHLGVSSYMCWEADEERLQNRIVPNISSFLATGTELSFVALKHQITSTKWYGGEAIPVLDIRWIVKQYYYSLLSYAELPTEQSLLDQVFKVDPNLWNARVEDKQYLTVEDEAYNMFEVRREFSTRAKEEGFVNILSTAYLLRDYMADNSKLFENDPKAIPYIVSDYDRTPRNVVLRLYLHMSVAPTSEDLIRRELMLVDITGEDLRKTLWHQLCMYKQPIGVANYDAYDDELLVLDTDHGKVTFQSNVIKIVRRFDPYLGKITRCYSIKDEEFISLVLHELQSAQYIAEDETGKPNYLGSELFGQIYQKHLPGQLFTLHGKYYEMLRGTVEGQILVRRAADHIDGRPTYRQQRSFHFYGLRDSEIMGESRNVGGILLKYMYADIRVDVGAYWAMKKYNDFSTAKHVQINGIPDRNYCNKRVLCLEFSEALHPTKEILRTLTLLLNEVFRTLFAENQSFVIAMLPGESEKPEFASLFGENGVDLHENCIYLVEDSQLDIGLLTAVERNYRRILSIACDYLEWHLEKLKKGETPEKPPFGGVDIPEPSPQTEAPKPPKKRFFLIRFFQMIWRGIKKFFGWLTKPFRRKKKQELPEPAQEPTPENVPEGAPEGTPEAAAPEGTAPEGKPETAAPENTSEGTSEQNAEGAGSESVTEAEAQEHSSETEPTETKQPNGDTITFEPEEPMPVDGDGAPAPKSEKYEDNYYLLYGRSTLLSWIVPKETLEFLQRVGADNSGLKQARTGKDLSQLVASGAGFREPGEHYCDFCGANITNTEYDVLKDGRERCKKCGSTAIKTQKEFVELYENVRKAMERYYRARITVPVDVKVVNSKKLHKMRGKTFVPTPGYDGRVVGFARQSGNKHTLVMENGAPKLAAAMTMVHELTHIWQYQNWDRSAIIAKYQSLEPEIYEGMAMWAEIQYAYLIGEQEAANAERLNTMRRDDEYGRGFILYDTVYPVSNGLFLIGDIPFNHTEEPIPIKK